MALLKKRKTPVLCHNHSKKHEFVTGKNSHNHAGTMGAYEAALVSKETKSTALAQPFAPATQIVQAAIQQPVDPRRPMEALKHVDYLARNANYIRSASRPKEPTGLDFEISMENLPNNFLIGDLVPSGARHLVFASEEQLHLLKNA